MLTGSELGAAIEVARIKKNVPKNALAKVFGISAPSVNGWVATGRIDKSKLIEVIRYFSDVVGPEHWGLTAEDADILQIAAPTESAESQAGSAADAVLKLLAKHRNSLTEEARQKIAAAVAETELPGTGENSNVIVADFGRRPIVGDEIRIAHYDVQGAMGNGKQVHDFPEMFRDVTVSQQHLRELGVRYEDPTHLKLITGVGESMSPTIQDKDPLIVDVTVREFTGDGIYAFVWDGLFYIKRLQRKGPDHFKMISDNKHHDPEDILVDQVYIQARVLLVWNAKRL